ncbi:MAG: hypothetical protein EOP56_08540 [Sphingobacteriales bacterium]|nr:MAG: hypothetical protein EOP56_08540 [Sphingobacteriales bacterium]
MQIKTLIRPLPVSIILLCIAVAVLYPYCSGYIDPDATAYLTIARRYATGDWARAVNGYWSPWACWLTALVSKVGFGYFDAALLVNTVGAIAIVYISYSLFQLFYVKWVLQLALGCSLSLFLAYAVYKQSFADIWACFFMLSVLRIMLIGGFFSRPALWILIGVLGALAYYAKAYYFPFFILHTFVVGYYIRRTTPMQDGKQWLKMAFTAVSMMVICAMPWIWVLHSKYGIWTTGTAGSLNTSWYLVGHPYWKEGFSGLLAPTYSDSHYYWEEPYLANGATPHFWDSGSLFLLQIVRAGYNVLKFVNSMNALSCFMMAIWVASAVVVTTKRWDNVIDGKIRVICVSVLLFPLGFLLINYEPRYLWYMVPLSMVLGGVLLQRIMLSIDRAGVRTLMVVVFAMSYIVWPVWDVRSMSTDMEEERIATWLRHTGVKSFAGNEQNAKNTPVLARLALRSNSQYYHAPQPLASHNLLREIRRYNIGYYLFIGDNLDIVELKDESGKAFPVVLNGKGLKVFRITAP